MTQVHDQQPGIQPNGLFWTTHVPSWSVNVHSSGQFATLWLPSFGLVDTFEGADLFNSTNAVNATVDLLVKWRATGAPVSRGEGASADPESPAAFSGELSDARAIGLVRSSQTGFGFETSQLDTDAFYANMGTVTNGAWL